jgi:hypothetical protein
MKGQVSIEFVSILIFTLLMSSILISNLEIRSANFQTEKDTRQAQKIAQKTSFKVAYASANKNSAVKLDYPYYLDNQYNISINSSSTVVSSPQESFRFETRYNGPKEFEFNTSKTYSLNYSKGGLKVD